MKPKPKPKALPPLLHHYVDALNHLQETNPEAFAHLAPLHQELELVYALSQQALRDHPDSELSRSLEAMNEDHGELPEIVGPWNVPHIKREMVGPWPPRIRDPRLDHLSVIVG